MTEKLGCEFSILWFQKLGPVQHKYRDETVSKRGISRLPTAHGPITDEGNVRN